MTARDQPVLNTLEMSNFQFTLQDQPITEKEAEALVSLSGSSDSPIKIELTKLVKIQKLNTKQLFNLAIEKKDESLAQLAYKLSIAPTAKTITTTRRRSVVPHQIPEDQLTTEQVIGTICRTRALWAAGASIILWAVYQAEASGEDQTIKSVSEQFVNHAWFDDLVPENCVIFDGFVHSPDANKSWDAVVSKKENAPRGTYHEGPVYAGVRAGLAWAKAHNLIETEEAISYGALSGKKNTVADHTQRKYYKILPTPFGADTMKEWSDCLDVAVNYFFTMR